MISLCGRGHAAADAELAEAVWDAGAVAVGWGGTPGHEAAKAARPRGRPGRRRGACAPPRVKPPANVARPR